MKNKLLNLLYRLLVKLVDHDSSEVSEEYANSWLMDSYNNVGFKNWLTSKYAHYTKYLAGTYRGEDEYKRIVWKLVTLRQLELEAKNAYQKSQENIKK